MVRSAVRASRTICRPAFHPGPFFETPASWAPHNSTVTAANGTIKAARARIAMLDVGGLVVRDVDAMVLPDEALSENLLGLSCLSRL
jgi:clan AA aspartic protease (TIGR02281 family)